MFQMLRVLAVAAVVLLFHVGNVDAVVVTSAFRNVHVSDVSTGEVGDDSSTTLGEFDRRFTLQTLPAGASVKSAVIMLSNISLSSHSLRLDRPRFVGSYAEIGTTGVGTIGSTTIDLNFVTDAAAASVAMDIRFGSLVVAGSRGEKNWLVQLTDVTADHTNVFAFDSASLPDRALSLSLLAGNAYRFLAFNQAFGGGVAASEVGFELTETMAPATVPVPASGLLLAVGFALGIRRRSARVR